MVKRIDANVDRAFTANPSDAPLPWGVAPGYSECRAFGEKPHRSLPLRLLSF